MYWETLHLALANVSALLGIYEDKCLKKVYILVINANICIFAKLHLVLGNFTFITSEKISERNSDWMCVEEC